ncbi:unnamed protein product [Rodentolepis nana]|uniref:BHLH domain-containing protein n=1 Tax=Rodentolepis nana TaxID=102285 RepID=A0A0R3TXT5_RODNA|nr:unnamed protein product [Rodentolepis nana]
MSKVLDTKTAKNSNLIWLEARHRFCIASALEMSGSSSSRARKQNFSPNNSSFFSYSDDIDTEDGSQDYLEDSCPPRRTNKTASVTRKISDPRDRQSQLDHNEQERGRRRELAIIYEMIRTCISEDDIRRHLDGTAKSADKLSYPQLLQISCGKIQDELHDQRIIRSLFRDIELLEQMCADLGIEIEKKRPAVDPMDHHKMIAEVVEEVLSVDKRSRNYNGEYVMSQRARAQQAHSKLNGLLVNVNNLVNISQTQVHHFPSSRENRPVGPFRRPHRRIQKRSRRPFWNRRATLISPLSSPVHSPFPPSPPSPSPYEDSRLSPEIIEEVISQFPPPLVYHEPSAPFLSSLDVHDLSDRGTIENGEIRFEESISIEEANVLLREFDVNGIDDLGFESLFGLVNSGNIPEEFDNIPFGYFP